MELDFERRSFNMSTEFVRLRKILEDVYPSISTLVFNHKEICVATISVLILTSIFCLYKILRVYHMVKVNCWFCNKNSTAQRDHCNSFICPFCDQYNGFDKDGGYNCTIPAQMSSSYNYPSNSKLSYTKHSRSRLESSNGLCDSCNLNQSLKVRALAEYSSNLNYKSVDVENFRMQLEEIYTLCQQCQALLRQTLGKQDSWLKPKLIAWRLQQTKNKLIKMSAEKYRSYKWKTVSMGCCLTSTLLCVTSVGHLLPSGWDLSLGGYPMEMDSIYVVVLALQAFMSSLYLFMPSNKCKMFCLISSGLVPLLLAEYLKSTNDRSILRYFKVVFSVLNLMIGFLCTKLVSSTLKSSRNSKSFKSVRRSLNVGLDTSKKNEAESIHNDSAYHTPESPSIFDEQTEPAGDLDSGLLGLKIGTPKKQVPSRSSSPFPQNLFLGNNEIKKNYDSSVIQPSKLGKSFITQSSWVAGGYWGSPGSPQRGRLTRQNVSTLEKDKPVQPFSLSRSSSQSSGFVSQFSEGTSSHSLPKLFRKATSTTSSQSSSIAEEPRRTPTLEKPNVYNTTPFGASQHTMDNWELFSACSASSLCSGNSQLRRRSPFSSPFIQGSSYPPSLANSQYLSDTVSNGFTNDKMKPETSYFNLGLAFFLGISISANLFFAIILTYFSG